MKVKEAIKITDSFTRTSKMPGLSYSLPAWECKTGWTSVHATTMKFYTVMKTVLLLSSGLTTRERKSE